MQRNRATPVDRLRLYPPDRVGVLARLLRTPYDVKCVMELVLARTAVSRLSPYVPAFAACERLHNVLQNRVAGIVDAEIDIEALLSEASSELDALPHGAIQAEKEWLAAMRLALPRVFDNVHVEVMPAPIHTARSRDASALVLEINTAPYHATELALKS